MDNSEKLSLFRKGNSRSIGLSDVPLKPKLSLNLNKETIANLNNFSGEPVGLWQTLALCFTWPRCSENNPNGCTNSCAGAICTFDCAPIKRSAGNDDYYCAPGE